PRQQQVGDISASYKQYACYGTQQYEQRRPDITNYLLVQRNQLNLSALVGIRILLSDPACDRVHIGRRLRQRHAGFDPPNRAEPENAPPQLILLWNERYKQRSVALWERKAPRQHAHDEMGLPVKIDCP